MPLINVSLITTLKIFAGILIAASFLVVTGNRADPDLGIHLAVGKWMVEHHAIERVDVHTYTMKGVAWVDHEWLLNLWIYLMHSRGLWWLVIFIFTFLAAFPLLVWVRRARSFIELLPVAFTAVPLIGFIGIRFQLVSFFFFFLLLELLAAVDARGVLIKKWWIAMLPVFFFAWANLHAGVVAGLVLFGVFTAAQFGEEWHRKRKIENRALWFCLAIFVASFLATLVNAFGWGLYEEILRAAVSPYVSKYIIEWRPALSFDRIPAPLFVAVFAFLAVLYRKKYPMPLLASAAMFFALFLRSVRMGPLFFLAALPIIIRGARYLDEERRGAAAGAAPPRHAFLPKIIGGGLYLSILSFLGYAVVAQKNEAVFLPEKATDFLVAETREGRATNVFNEYAWGGYIMWRAPSVRLFIDGRLPHVVDEEGNSAMEDYVNMLYSARKRDWREVIARREIDAVIIPNVRARAETELRRSHLLRAARYLRDTKFVQSLSRVLQNTLFKEKAPMKGLEEKLLEEGWRIVYEDAVAIVLSCKPDACLGTTGYR